MRLDRLEARGVARDDAERRIAAQATDEERRAVATWVVDNAGDLARLGPPDRRDLARARRGRGRRRSADRNNCHTPPVRIAPVPEFELVTDLAPAGDQPEAIAALVDGRRARRPVPDAARHHRLGQELHDRQRDRARRSGPTLVLAPEQVASPRSSRAEFRELFPKNRVEYFVSYYDYYQPEAYLPSTDTYIEKDSSINDEIDRLRHSATSALLHPARRDHRGVGVGDLRPRLARDVRASSC